MARAAFERVDQAPGNGVIERRGVVGRHEEQTPVRSEGSGVRRVVRGERCFRYLVLDASHFTV